MNNRLYCTFTTSDNISNVIDKIQTRSRLYDLVDYKKYNSLDKKIYNFNTDGNK